MTSQGTNFVQQSRIFFQVRNWEAASGGWDKFWMKASFQFGGFPQVLSDDWSSGDIVGTLLSKPTEAVVLYGTDNSIDLRSTFVFKVWVEAHSESIATLFTLRFNYHGYQGNFSIMETENTHARKPVFKVIRKLYHEVNHLIHYLEGSLFQNN